METTSRPDWTGHATFFFCFAAKNDSNGNPRRVFAFYDSHATLVGAADEGYAGLPEWARRRVQAGTLADGGRVPVAPAFRRETLARARSLESR